MLILTIIIGGLSGLVGSGLMAGFVRVAKSKLLQSERLGAALTAGVAGLCLSAGVGIGWLAGLNLGDRSNMFMPLLVGGVCAVGPAFKIGFADPPK